MIYTRICNLLRIEHPILLGGMGTATSPALVAAVSDAGGFGTQGHPGSERCADHIRRESDPRGD
jgi:NAD(P)H-dependent flavin oxidoreductase YrpB (nitropropane dioxygenase family)